MFDVIDDLHFSFVTQDFENVKILTNILRCDIFHLVEEKMKGESFCPLSMLSYISSQVDLIIPHQFYIHKIEYYIHPHLLIYYERTNVYNRY